MNATTSIFLLSAAMLFSGIALVCAFIPRIPAAAAAFIALLLASFSAIFPFSTAQLCFWGVATLIAVALTYLRPANPVPSSPLRYYIVGGALAGSVIGLAIGSKSAVIIASAVAAWLALVAFKRTPAGRNLSTDLNTFAALALPAIVNFSMLMLIFSILIQ